MLQEIRRIARSHEVFRKILAANDGSEHAFKALSAAFSLALSHQAELRMIMVEEVPRFAGSIAEVRGEIELADHRFAPVISKSKSLAAREGLPLHCHLIPGHAASTIVEFACERAFDLIVIGLAPHSGLYHRLIGCTAFRVIEQAHCAVLVVK
jgi:nucleotide-binding universal stress UspA family protein